MSVRVSFNLDDADLEHLAAIAQQTQLRARSEPADAIIAGAREVLETANRAQLAGFVKERYSSLDAMLRMVGDSQWQLSAEDRQRTLNALACFSSSSAKEIPSKRSPDSSKQSVSTRCTRSCADSMTEARFCSRHKAAFT